MKEQYKALDDLVHSLQLKYESNTDDGATHVDNKKVAAHLKWCSFESFRLFDDIQVSDRVVAGDIRSQPNENEVLNNYEDVVADEEAGDYDFVVEPESTEVQQQMDQKELVPAVAEAVGVLIKSVSHIRLDINNDIRDEHPTRLADIVHCEDKTFRSLLVAHTAKLTDRFDSTAIKEIWSQRKRLIYYFNHKSDYRRRIENQPDMDLEVAWGKVNVLGNFELLSSFAVGLASIAPGTHTVESDFSTLKRTKGPHRGRLSNYAMEGELQARQYFELMELADKVAMNCVGEAAE